MAGKGSRMRAWGMSLASALVLALLLVLSPASAFANLSEEAILAHAVSSSSVGNLVLGGGGYSAILYDNTNGLPTPEANDIVQAPDGFLWIGSYSGLSRYDGNKFERIGVSEGITSVTTLHACDDGRLWIGTNDNGLFVMEDGEYAHWGEEEGLPSLSVRGILEDGKGGFYISTTGGLVTMDAEGELHPIGDSRVKDAFVSNMRIGSDGIVYGVTNDGDLFALEEGKVITRLQHASLPGDGASCILPDPHKPGYVYVELENSIVLHGALSEGVNDMEKIDISPLSQVHAFEYVNGHLWVCAANGTGILDDNGIHIIEGLPIHGSISHVIEDYAGNLWFTSNRQGVMKIAPNRFVDYSSQVGLPEGTVNTTCLAGDRLFVGMDSGLRVCEGTSLLSSLPLEEARTASGVDVGATDLVELLDGVRIRSITKDSKGRLWIATWRGPGLIRYEDGKATFFTIDDGMPTDHVRAVWECRDGSLLVAVTGGMCVIEDDAIVARYGEDAGVGNTEILTVCEGFDGERICGTDGGGIYVFDDGGMRHIGREDGLGSEVVMRVKPDSANDVYWVVTGNTLAYMTRDYEVHSIEQFPYFNNFDLYENHEGEMWILSSSGIYIASKESLLANEEIDTVHYGVSDGLPYTATPNSYSALSEDGTLYIAGSPGVVAVDVDARFHEIVNLNASIPYVDVDGKRLYMNSNGEFTIPASARKLTIYPYVFNYSLVNPQISYKLEGFDDSEVSIPRSELGPVDYTNLPGGEYRFVITMRDPVHQEMKVIAASINKEKHIYEHPWFYAVTLLGGALAAFFSIRSYVARKTVAIEEQARADAERDRIESELAMAKQIQASALPSDFPAFPDRGEIDVYASMEPAKEVGGDFYDFFLVDDDHLCLVIADVSGKGIPAALFMMVSKSVLKNNAMLGIAPSEILERTNETICANNEMDMFVTVWLGILELSTGKIVAANAGHEYPMVGRANGEFELIHDKHGLVVGVMENARYRDYELQLEPGDKIFLYTDGLTEAADEESQLFGFDRIVDALNLDVAADPEGVLKGVHGVVDVFVGEAEQFDDLTMLCAEYKGKEA